MGGCRPMKEGEGATQRREGGDPAGVKAGRCHRGTVGGQAPGAHGMPWLQVGLWRARALGRSHRSAQHPWA